MMMNLHTPQALYWEAIQVTPQQHSYHKEEKETPKEKNKEEKKVKTL